MARKPRIIGPQLYHHIYAWGNDHHPIFKNKSNHEMYLNLLPMYASQNQIDVIAYALMGSHVHLFVFDAAGKLSNFMNNLHGSYAQYFNTTLKRVGHVFGERFNSKVVQFNNYGVWLSRYIHRQPIEAGLVKDPRRFSWTSYRAYLGLEKKDFLQTEIILSQFGLGKIALLRYEDFVLGKQDDQVKWDTNTISVIGDNTFVEHFNTVSTGIVKRLVDKPIGEDLIKITANHFKCKLEILMNPIGREERKLRHRAFDYLVNEHGLSARHVSRLFNVTPKAVVKSIRCTARTT
ncbi:MAG: transposase [Spirochaetota bacterium]|nr:MAG: transposase [Spirochaetota bacterium]